MTDTITCGNCAKSFSSKIHCCPFCGVKHNKECTRSMPVCPRCGCELENHNYHGNDLDICPLCSGLWLDNREFRKLTSRRDTFKDDSIPYEFKRKPLPHENKYLKCPLCNSIMVRRNFSKISGVLIDICRHHGIWLDAGELEQIRSFVANGGLDDYHDKEIVMNSEATSSVDTFTESLLQKAVPVLMENRTSIVVAHRLSTVRNVDRIHVLARGRIRETGTHSELMELNGLYAKLSMMHMEK